MIAQIQVYKNTIFNKWKFFEIPLGQLKEKTKSKLPFSDEIVGIISLIKIV